MSLKTSLRDAQHKIKTAQDQTQHQGVIAMTRVSKKKWLVKGRTYKEEILRQEIEAFGERLYLLMDFGDPDKPRPSTTLVPEPQKPPSCNPAPIKEVTEEPTLDDSEEVYDDSWRLNT